MSSQRGDSESNTNATRNCLSVFKVLGIFLFIHAIAVYLFTSGFLLTRLELPRRSVCESSPVSIEAMQEFAEAYPYEDTFMEALQRWKESGSPRAHSAGSNGCWNPKRVSKAILVLIDALRYDFASERLPTVQMHLKETTRSRLFVFEADPPTTTLQRLKALVTGGMPTFVDVGSNFDSDKLAEDNIIHQLSANGRSIVMMGDDTWTNLFPDSFNKSFPFPSFNVKDLHTVDEGVLEHLVPEIKAGDFDVLIAHFLGVDHIGHRYRAGHPAMVPKLAQLDAAVANVIEEMTDDTVLLVFGDHGMTSDGNHGGTTPQETDAALFIYSKHDIFSATAVIPERVKQVDLVPTLSLLLGVPIPHGSLGSIIVSLFEDVATTKDRNEQVLKHVEALRINSWQVQAYLHEYASNSNIFESERMQHLIADFLAADAMYLNIVSDMKTTPPPLRDLLDISMRLQDVLLRSGLLCREKWTTFNLEAMVWGILLLLTSFVLELAVIFVQPHLDIPSLSVKSGLTGAVAGAVLSGSYMTIMGRSSDALIPSLIWPTIGCMVGMIYSLYYSSHVPPPAFSIKYAACVAIILAYSQGLFSNCLIEVEDKVVHYLLATFCLVLGFLHVRTIGNDRTPIALLAVVAMASRLMGSGADFGPGAISSDAFHSPLQLLETYGSLLCLSLIHCRIQKDLLSRVLGVVVCLSSGIYWWLDTVETDRRPWFFNWIPCSIYLLSILCVAYLLLPRTTVSSTSHHSVTRAKLALFLFAFVSTTMLLWGPRSPRVVLIAVLMLLILDQLNLHFVSLLLISWLLSSRIFHATGHNSLFSSLQVSSAFVGFEEFQFFRSGTMLALNTFGALGIAGIGTALLSSNSQHHDILKSSIQWKSFWPLFSRVSLGMSLLYTLRALLTAINVAIQRRHLMVWEIFAPKFMFDCTALFFSEIFQLLVTAVLNSISY